MPHCMPTCVCAYLPVHYCSGKSRRRLAGRILVAPPPTQLRLIPLIRQSKSGIAHELEHMRVMCIRALLPMPF